MLYRFLRLTPVGKVDAVRVAEMHDRDAMVRYAEAIGRGCPVEVWQKDRQLLTVSPRPERARA